MPGGCATLSLGPLHPTLLCPPELLWPQDLPVPPLWGLSSQSCGQLTTTEHAPCAGPWVQNAFSPVFFIRHLPPSLCTLKHRQHEFVPGTRQEGGEGTGLPDFKVPQP